MNVTRALPRPTPAALKFDRNDGSYLLRRDAFQDAYVGQVAVTVGNPAVSSALKGVGLETAYRVASQLLGPLQALALGGEAMATLVSSQDAQDLDQ
jgi:hypothetical protein